jgi:uncharacterized protein
MMSIRPVGRGRNYTMLRGVGELLMRATYRASWPARAWDRVPGRAEVTRIDHRIALSRERPLRAPLRIAFASDLHLGPTTPRRTLDRAFALLAEASPAVLVLGGDYVFLDATRAMARELGERVRAVPAKVKVAVLGNHDLWTRHDWIEEALAGAGARVLVNEAVRLPPPHDEVAVLGLDDPWTGSPDGARAVASCGDAAVKIAVSHSPDGVPFLVGRGVSLVMAGHTHGGQIALPGPRPIVVPGPLGKRWPYGLHEHDGMKIFVSRGVGTTELPIRAFAPPDVAVFELC